MNQRRRFDSALRTLGRAFVHVRWPAEATDPDAALERSAVGAPHPRARTRRAPRSLQATRLPRRPLLYRLGLLLMALLFLMKTPHPGLAHSQPLGRTASSAPAGSSFGSVATGGLAGQSSGMQPITLSGAGPSAVPVATPTLD